MTYTAIAAGNTSALALRSDGAVVNFREQHRTDCHPRSAGRSGLHPHLCRAGRRGVAATGHTTGLSASPDQIAINETLKRPSPCSPMTLTRTASRSPLPA